MCVCVAKVCVNLIKYVDLGNSTGVAGMTESQIPICGVQSKVYSGTFLNIQRIEIHKRPIYICISNYKYISKSLKRKSCPFGFPFSSTRIHINRISNRTTKKNPHLFPKLVSHLFLEHPRPTTRLQIKIAVLSFAP